MNNKKYISYLRKFILSSIAYWGYVLVCYAGVMILIALYTDVDAFGVEIPRSFYTLQTVLSYIAFIPLFYDFLVCDRVSQNEYTKKVQSLEDFSIVAEIKSLFVTTDFLVGAGVILIMSMLAPKALIYFVAGFISGGSFNGLTLRLFVLAVFTLPAIIMYAAAVIITHARWFGSKDCYNPNEKVKGIYAIRLIRNALIWVIDFLLLVFLIVQARFTLDPIRRGLGAYIPTAILALIALLIFIYIFRRVRALYKQMRFLSKLRKFCKENKIRLREPKNPYRSVLKQKPETFSLEHRLLSFNCVLLPSVVRKIPVYFTGEGTIERVKTYRFLKIELFSRTKTVSYKFRSDDNNGNKIIVLSPVPREIFTGIPAASKPADNGTVVDGATIYNGSAFCNYVQRIIENETYKLENKNQRRGGRIFRDQ